MERTALRVTIDRGAEALVSGPMSDQWRGPGWWYASDGKWYPPALDSDLLDHDAAALSGHTDHILSSSSDSDDFDVPEVIRLDEFEVVDLAAGQAEPADRNLAMASARPDAEMADATRGWVRATGGSAAHESDVQLGSGGSSSTEGLASMKLSSDVISSADSKRPVRSGEPTNPVAAEPEEPAASSRSSVVFIAALLLALLSGVLGALWLRERAVSADLRADLAEASQQQDEIDLTDLEDALNTARVQNQQLEQQVADMSALVLALPAGRLTEITVPFDPAFADESSGRLIAISAEGEYVIWGDGADSPITDSGTLPDMPTGLFAGSARSWISTEAGLVEILPMRPEIAPEPPIEYGPLVHVVSAEDARSYWSYNTDLGQIVRLERNGGAVTDAVSVPVPVVDITIGAGSVWALGDDGLVYRINTADLTLQSFDLGPDLISITAGPDALWTLSAADGSLRRVDPVTGSVLVTVPVGRDPIDAMFAGSSVWVGLRSGSSMIEVDTATSAVVSRTELSSEPAQLYEGDSGVYVSTVGEGSPLLRIDSLSSTVDAQAQAQAAEGAEGE